LHKYSLFCISLMSFLTSVFLSFYFLWIYSVLSPSLFFFKFWNFEIFYYSPETTDQSYASGKVAIKSIFEETFFSNASIGDYFFSYKHHYKLHLTTSHASFIIIQVKIFFNFHYDVFSMIYGLFRNALLNFQIFGNFLLPLCSQFLH